MSSKLISDMEREREIDKENNNFDFTGIIKQNQLAGLVNNIDSAFIFPFDSKHFIGFKK